MKLKKIVALICAAIMCGALLADGGALVRPVPRAQLQRRFAEGIDVIGIVHWGLNTFTDREWGYGDEDPADLNPKSFDADQIVGACKAGGLQGLVVVAKHHDGFCLWPTKTTEHNITKSPFRGGKGDYVREMADACRRAGLKFGVYCSPWDRNSADYGTDRYLEIYRAQLRELLTNYGDVFEMWFDNANGGDGYYGGAREKRKIPKGYYGFGDVFRLVRSLQPNVCIFNEHDEADLRFCGTETGYVDPDSRSTGLHCDGVWTNYVKWANSGVVEGTTFLMVEADFPLRPGWFYHAAENGKARSAESLMKTYLGTVGNAATMNIGIAPTKDGILCDEDVKALQGFGRLRQAFFAQEVKVPGAPFNLILMREDVADGEHVDGWEFVADGKVVASGRSIGYKRMRLLPSTVSAKEFDVKVTACEGRCPDICISRYLVDPVLADTVMKASGKTGETEVLKALLGDKRMKIKQDKSVRN